jgi:holo-[acyl-carrier protein] synthase
MSNVIGSGIDLVENARIREMIERWGGRFVDRVFCAREQAYCSRMAAPHQHYAGRFAVKEAVSKAFQTGIGPQVSWLDIEVLRNPNSGAPSVALSGQAAACAERLGVKEILVSLAHTRDYAVANATLLSRPVPRREEPV